MFSKITSELAVASAFDELPSAWAVLDVRGLVDGPGNSPAVIEEYVESGLKILALQSQKLVIVCDYGQSRSNFIAARIHSSRMNIVLAESIELVRKAHPDSQIKPAFLYGETKIDSSRSISQITISGGSGLIGRRLIEELKGLGIECQVLTRQCHGEYLQDGAALRAAIGGTRPDLFIHLAHPKPVNAESTTKVALTQLISVANYCEDEGVSLAYPSSWVVFDGSTNEVVDSLSKVSPHSRYGQLKAMIETYLCLSYRDRLDVKILRLPALFGHESLEPRFLRYFANCASNRENLVFHEFKNGPARVPLVDVDAFVPSFAKCLAEFRCLPFLSHLGHSTQPPTVGEIAMAVAKSAGVAAKGVSIERSVFTGHFLPDIPIPGELKAGADIHHFIAQLCER